MAVEYGDRYSIEQAIAEEALAKDESYLTNAVSLAGTKGAGMMYEAIMRGESQGNMWETLGNMFTGRGQGQDPRLARQDALFAIFEKYGDPESYEEMVEIANVLRTSGFPDEAALAMKEANEFKNAETNRINANKTTTTNPDYNLQARNYYALQTNKDTWTGSLDQQRALLEEMGGMGFLGTTPYNALAKNIEEEDDKIVAKEASIESGALDISKRYAGRDIVNIEAALSNVENLIAKYDAQAPGGKGDIPGVNSLEKWLALLKSAPHKLGGKAGKEAEEFIQAIAAVENMLLKKRSGAAVTESEYVRFLKELKGGFYATDDGMRNFINQLRAAVEWDKDNIMAGYSIESQNRYLKRAGIHPTLAACKVENSKECKAAWDKLPPGSIYFIPGDDKRRQKSVVEET